MKRGLVLTLCAVALAAAGNLAQAQTVNLSLNLRYTNPANPASGGSWYLVAKTPDDADGISAISAYINNINAPTPMGYGTSGAVDTRYTAISAAQLAALLNGGNPYNTTVGGAVNVVYGQDTANGPLAMGVGTAGFAQRQVADPLKNTAWDNATLIVNGTFGATRPTIATNVGTALNNTDANTHTDAVVGGPSQDAATSIIVRGDSERSLGVEGANKGLRAGDANRDGTVNSADLALLLTHFNGSNKTWDQGNFNNTAGSPNTAVNSADLALLLTNFNQVGIPVSVSPIPEPTSLALAAFGCLAAAAIRRKAA